MASRRGRILQTLSSSARETPPEARRDDQIAPPTEPAPAPHPEPSGASSRSIRGRGGRILSQLASLNLHDPPPVSGDPVISTDSSSSPAGRLSRQTSDLSKASEQFVVDEENYKATLPKEPTTAGTRIDLSLNYMTFETKDSASIEEYHVDYNPNIESTRLRYSLLRTDAAKAIIGEVIHWTGTNLFLPHKLPDRVTVFAVPHPVNQTPVQVKMTFVKTPPDSELLPFYNSLMHKVMTRLRYVVINRQHYSPMHRISIDQHKLEVWPGWITAIQRLDGGLKLIVDASFKVLRLETVYDILVAIKNRQRGVNLKEAFEEALIGKIVMTRYNNRAYRIDGIDLTKKPTDTFTMTRGDGGQISYIDYMRNHWNQEVSVPNQPMLIHKPKPRRGEPEGSGVDIVYLIPELCVTTGLTDEMRANFNIMRDIIEKTRVPPEIRETKLKEFIDQIATDERAKTVFSDWNLSVRRELDRVEGRRFDNETLLGGNNRTIQVPDNVDWTRPVTSSQVYRSVDIEKWVLIHQERDSGVAEDFGRTVREVSQQLGIKFFPPRVVKLRDESARAYVEASKKEVKVTDQMVVVLTPGRSQREDRYSACKRLYSTEICVPSQFIRCGTIDNDRKRRSVVQKVVIQILSKVGGAPWAMKFPMKSFMVVGIDVYHDTIDRKRSCLGLVASMNDTASSWWSRTFFQNSLEEIGQKLNMTMIHAIRKFHFLNGCVPSKIIVYRDGVGDGQLEVCLSVEIAQLMGAIKFYMRDNHDGVAEPQVSYIVVQKRINTKMAWRDRGSVKNPLPGSFLDHTITHPDYNDFYLVSQHVTQGTVSPTHYIVLAETGSLKMMHHQKMAYKMAHMYYNWTGTIRVPAPCQYAHKLAYLTGQNIRTQANESLEDRLYYL